MNLIEILGSRGDQGVKGDMGLIGMPGKMGEQGPPVNIYLIVVKLSRKASDERVMISSLLNRSLGIFDVQ